MACRGYCARGTPTRGQQCSQGRANPVAGPSRRLSPRADERRRQRAGKFQKDTMDDDLAAPRHAAARRPALAETETRAIGLPTPIEILSIHRAMRLEMQAVCDAVHGAKNDAKQLSDAARRFERYAVVFRAHGSAEDDLLLPALELRGSPDERYRDDAGE